MSTGDTTLMLYGAGGALAASVGYLGLPLSSSKTMIYVAGGAALPYIVNMDSVAKLMNQPSLFVTSPMVAYAGTGALLSVVAYKLFGSY